MYVCNVQQEYSIYISESFIIKDRQIWCILDDWSIFVVIEHDQPLLSTRITELPYLM